LSVDPKRGEIWYVDLEPTRGAEMKKVRPCLVVSADYIGKLPIKLIGPITEWNHGFGKNLWMTRLEPDENNGLRKVSALDALQLRGVDVARFKNRIGVVKPSIMEEIAASIVIAVGYQ